MLQVLFLQLLSSAGTGLFIGVFLGVAGEISVEVDEREEAILGVLPGNNCGGCGYAGCSGLAAAIAKEKLTGQSVSGRRRSGSSKSWRDHGSCCRCTGTRSCICKMWRNL